MNCIVCGGVVNAHGTSAGFPWPTEQLAELRARAEKAEAEVARLRAALTKMADGIVYGSREAARAIAEEVLTGGTS